MSEQPNTGENRLSKRRLGVPAITLMIIAASAPLTVVAGGVPTSFAVTESMAVPVGFLILSVMIVIFAVGFTAMGRHITNSGAFYAYVSQGIGRPLGVGTSLVAVVAYNAMQVGIYGLFGFQLSLFIEMKTGWASPWWMWIFLCIILVAVLGMNRIDLSAKVLGVLVALEFVAVIVFDILALGVAPEGVTATTINPAAAITPIIGIVLLFNFAAFMGFEGAAIYGEEAKDPKRTVPRATYAAVLIIGLFYALSAWAFSVGIGPSNIVAESQAFGPDLMFIFVGEHTSQVVADLMTLLFLTSLFAALQSFHNAVARYLFSMGREGLIPRGFARTSAAGAPIAGSLTQTVIAVIVVLGFTLAGEVFGGADSYGEAAFLFPVFTMFTWLTNTGALGLVLLMLLATIAVIGYFRKHPNGLNAWTRIIAPGVSALFLAWVLILALSNFQLMLAQEVPDASTYILPGLLFVALGVGVVWGFALKRKNPAVYEHIGRGTPPGEFGTEMVGVIETDRPN